MSRGSEWGEGLNPLGALVVGTFFVIGILIIVPILIALEVKAWVARHRMRKEQTNA